MADASESAQPLVGSPINSTEDFARYNRAAGHTEWVVASAVSANPPDLRVTATGGSSITIAPGEAIINGFRFRGALAVTRSISTNATSSTARIDTVVVEIDQSKTNGAGGTVKVIKGTATAPALTRTISGIWQMPIAKITIKAGKASVAAADVTDRRSFGVPNPVFQTDGSQSNVLALGQFRVKPGGLYFTNPAGADERIWPMTTRDVLDVIPDPDFIKFTFSATGEFRNREGDGHYDAAYCKDFLGFVHLRGRVESRSGTVPPGKTIARLPKGFRPAYHMAFAVNGNGGFRTLFIVGGADETDGGKIQNTTEIPVGASIDLNCAPFLATA